MSASNHMVYTDRPAKQKDGDNRSEHEVRMRGSQLSFDDERSMVSNTQSHYIETMTDLTS
jgi:hypothetical protein